MSSTRQNTYAASLQTLNHSLRGRIRHFGRNEDGALIIFALMLMWLMVMMGGIALDFMRFEATRTTLQNTLDRSTLAAASLTQALNAEDVVTDYFAKAGMSQYLNSVTVTEGINFRNVDATASADSAPYFLPIFGINDLSAPGHSTAEQRVTNVEITLVLDVSGSMASNNKLVNLKSAAKEFVDTVLSSDPEHRIAIAMVPFNGQVNLGPTLVGKYNRTYANGISGADCVDLPASTYNQLGMSRTLALPATSNADTYSTTNTTTSYVSYSDSNYAVDKDANKWCPSMPGNIVRLPTTNAATLKSQIDGLSAVGATSINAGLNWGMALMDPGARPMFAQLISAGAMTSDTANRPYDYSDREAMKVIVLMTDGEHFAEERVSDTYRSGNSIIYRSNSDNNYSIYHASVSGSNKYWVPHKGTWQSTPWNGGVVQTWPQVWSNLRMSYVAWQFYARALGTSGGSRTTVYNNQMAAFKSQTATSTMDSQLQTICTLSKNAGVTIYGIAFEAPAGGQTQISQCASSPAHYFNASGLQIKTAFRTIASNISQLRLTQ